MIDAYVGEGFVPGMSSGEFSRDQESRTTETHPACMCDYYLGGYHNVAAGREATDAMIAIRPEHPLVMQANRAFLRRTVRFLVSQGIEQFLDDGTWERTSGRGTTSQSRSRRMRWSVWQPVVLAGGGQIPGILRAA